MKSDVRVTDFKTLDIKMLHWNINGVKNKFSSEFVVKLIEEIDILIIQETHFNIRIKCPEKFYLVGRSDALPAKKPRGGVAIYQSFNCKVKLEKIDIDIDDCVVAEICDSNVVIAAPYIPPNSSIYFKKDYFTKLQSFLDTYSRYRDIIIVGDLNARAGDTLNHANYTYNANPDRGMNQNGKVLKDILSEYNKVVLINGLQVNNTQFNNELTFYRGKASSRNDLCFSNNINMFTDFIVLPKNPLSDHCPLKIMIKMDIDLWMAILPECVAGMNNYDHYDKSKKIKQKIRIDKCNIAPMIDDFEKLGNELNEKYSTYPSDQEKINKMCNELTTNIYDVIRRNKKKPDDQIPEPTQTNCNSKNFFAISEAHASQYHRLKYDDPIKAKQYKDQWCYYLQIALNKEEEEMNARKDRSWRVLYKNDSKALWKQIEWKQKEFDRKKSIPPKVIHDFFTDIFQSPSLLTVPKIESIMDNLRTYTTPNNDMDADITEDEVNNALLKIGSGTSYDGISPDIISIIPQSLKESVQTLFNGVFHYAYPSSWIKQLLIPTPKKGHTIENPKLRGVAIGPILSRLFDIVINKRFVSWYSPNPQQAGFRKGQGCILQIFALILLTDFSRIANTNLYIGLFDYEKAFDYLCRPLLIEEMMKDGAGSSYTQCMYNMYKETSYVPQTSSKTMGEEIFTPYGVTQGRSSSANIFSYYISDMMEKVMVDDPLLQDIYSLFCLLQLADDTTIFAEDRTSFKERAYRIAIYSAIKFLRINELKTKYLNMSNSGNRCREDIIVHEQLCIKAVNDDEGYNWLGFWLTHNNKIFELIRFNLKKKKYNIAKFYEWLNANNETPIKVKIDVLYSCLFSSILYSCEAWGDLTMVEDEINLIERKALKAILGVKQATTDVIVYAELNRAEVSALIRDRQVTFWKKFQELTIEDAISKLIYNFYREYCGTVQGNMCTYYDSLRVDNKGDNLNMIGGRIINSAASMCVRYRSVIGIPENPIFLYTSLTNEIDRELISRWRLSSHPLYIETGRRKVPKVPREQRLCIMCNTLEDQNHSFFLQSP